MQTPHYQRETTALVKDDASSQSSIKPASQSQKPSTSERLSLKAEPIQKMQTKVMKVSQKLIADQLDSSLHVSNVDDDSVDK